MDRDIVARKPPIFARRPKSSGLQIDKREKHVKAVPERGIGALSILRLQWFHILSPAKDKPARRDAECAPDENQPGPAAVAHKKIEQETSNLARQVEAVALATFLRNVNTISFAFFPCRFRNDSRFA